MADFKYTTTLLIQRASEFGVLPPDVFSCYHRQAAIQAAPAAPAFQLSDNRNNDSSEELKHIMADGGVPAWR